MNEFDHFTQFGDNSHQDPFEEPQVPKRPPEENNKEPRKKFSIPFRWLLLVFILALAGGILGAAAYQHYLLPSQVALAPVPSTTDSSTPTTPSDPNGHAIPDPEDKGVVAAVASKVMPAVVGLTLDQTVTENIWFRQYEYEVQVTGSGVIVDPRGYILTNSHVVGADKSKEVEVLFEDGSILEAEILWSDPLQDLAVIKVEPEDALPYAELGDSDALLIGEPAIAIGNPLGLDFQRSVTAGYVSGLNRNINVQGHEMNNLIQTDASINQGNSGGPLLNAKGQVIGINTIKIGSGEGLGFSIPINTAKAVVKQIIDKGHYEPVVLGIQGYDVKYVANRLGTTLPAETGVYVWSVAPGSGADLAQLKMNDIILGIDDYEVLSMNSLRAVLGHYQVDDEVVLKILRDGEPMDLNLKFVNFNIQTP